MEKEKLKGVGRLLCFRLDMIFVAIHESPVQCDEVPVQCDAS